MSEPTQALPGEDGGACVETGWLVERDPDGAMVLVYADAEGWTHDASKALRFAREQDARAYIEARGWRYTRIAEHRWG